MEQLHLKIKKLKTLSSLKNTLFWDSSTMLPQAAVKSRGEQMTLLEELQNSILDSISETEVNDHLNNSEDEIEKRNFELLGRVLQKHNAADNNLKTKIIEQQVVTEAKWREAKEKQDFSIVANELSDMLSLTKEYANCITAGSESPYNALMQDYNHGSSEENLTDLFNALKDELIPLRNSIIEIQSPRDKENYTQVNDVYLSDTSIVNNIVKDMGFDFTKGRIDHADHPFSCGEFNDVRFTLPKAGASLQNNIMAGIHEAGHAIYSQNLPAKYQDNLIGHAVDMAIHESQSLIWEFCTASTEEFTQYLSNTLQQYNIVISPEKLHAANWFVNKDAKRYEADQISYPLHVIMRYEIEQQLINHNYPVKDLPLLWEEKSKEYNLLLNKEGCLQDIHWYMGSFGYFPSYLTGLLIASQLFVHIAPEKSKFIDGNFLDFKKSLNKTIHNKGHMYDANDLIYRITGKGIGTESFLNRIKQKGQ